MIISEIWYSQIMLKFLFEDEYFPYCWNGLLILWAASQDILVTRVD